MSYKSSKKIIRTLPKDDVQRFIHENFHIEKLRDGIELTDYPLTYYGTCEACGRRYYRVIRENI